MIKNGFGGGGGGGAGNNDDPSGQYTTSSLYPTGSCVAPPLKLEGLQYIYRLNQMFYCNVGWSS